MKKILSLVLAVLMLGTMTVSASAAGDVLTFSDLLDFYKYYTTEKNPYEGLGDYLAGGFYTRWLDTCPKCSGAALFQVKDSAIHYSCTESKCGATGSYNVGPETGDKVPAEKPDGVLTIECSKCDRIAKYAGKVTLADKTYYGYICEKEHETFVEKKDAEIEWDKINLSPIKCSLCTKYAEFDSVATYFDKVYGLYVCEKGHKNYKVLDENLFAPAEKEYSRVYVSVNGNGSYAIDGSSFAKYGEIKTVKFTPAKGYYLSKVTVDGKTVEVVNNKVSFKVTEDTIVRATFTKHVENVSVTTVVSGNGSAAAYVNNKAISAKASVAYGSTVTFKLVPASANYAVSSIKINGKAAALPVTKTLTISDVTADTKVEITFAWKSPYSDVTSKYLKAVEYVTEAGIMGATGTDGKNILFNGSSAATVKAFASALAEMADVDNKLDTTAERIVWAEKYGLVKADTDLSATCTVQAAAKMVDTYLSVLEELNGIDFVKYDADSSVKDNAVAISMVTAKTYENNRNLCRYDLASVCRLIANLDYKG